MPLSRDVATTLFREGKFRELVELSGSEKTRAALDIPERTILSTALAFLGHFDEAERLASLTSDASISILARSQSESTFAIVKWRRGLVSGAIRHAQSALRFAQDSQNSERIAWAHVHLFRLLIEGGCSDNALAMLPEVRRGVAHAGIGQVSAYLHLCVAVLEGQTGRLDEARRHCGIVDSLLTIAPNLWLSGQSTLLNGTISIVGCEFDSAFSYLTSAKQMANKSGHSLTLIAAESNLGHIELLIGHFGKARSLFSRLIGDASVPPYVKFAAAGGLARVHLALGELDACDEALSLISSRMATEDAGFLYQVRWSAVTVAQLLIKKGTPADAVQWLEEVEQKYGDLNDIPLLAALHLVGAQAFAKVGDIREASRRMLFAGELQATSIRELHGQYYATGARLARAQSRGLSTHLTHRANRVWKNQGMAATELEMTDSAELDQFQELDGATCTVDSVECVTNSLASLGELAHWPMLLGTELLTVIDALKCSADATIVETPEGAPQPNSSGDSVALPLGVERRRRLTLVGRIPADPVKAILLADVLRIGRSAIALRHAREEERSRAALWPAPPIEEQAGALFLAEDMKTLLATARRISPTTVPVLITGETGTGKEVLARTIHAYSARAAGTFLPFNCSSVPKDMLDSQLFGHKRGSFTGAMENFPGVIRAATGGTLFLDEIGEMTLDVQPKLLRFLESSEVHPIGETQPVKTDVRVIAATNADLDQLLGEGRFREDLFYRLNIVRLHIPPLRERRVEIPTLAQHYLHKHAQEYRKGNLRLAEETMEYLVLYRWPGNVRQLANEMRRLAALAETDTVLMPEHLSPDIAASRKTVPASERTLEPSELVVRIDQPLSAAVQHLERAMIQHAMRLTGGRMEETATLLGLSRKGLYLKRVRYGLELAAVEGANSVDKEAV
jgi:DNA-binding NtrC family response regulator